MVSNADLSCTVAAWIKRLSQPRRGFADLPACPFASTAMVETLECSDLDQARVILRSLESLPIRKVLVLGMPDNSADDCHTLVSYEQDGLAERDLLAFVSDPHKPVIIAGFRTTQRARVLIIIQKLSDLVKAEKDLRRLGYYDRWPRKAIDRVFAHRAGI